MSEVEKALERLDALDAMFQTDGWGFFLKDLIEEYERLGDISLIADATQLTQHKAIRESLAVLIHYPDICELSRERLLNPPKEDEDDGA